MANVSQVLKDCQPRILYSEKYPSAMIGKSRDSQMKENEEDLLPTKLPLTNVYRRFLIQKGKGEKKESRNIRKEEQYKGYKYGYIQ